MTLVWRKVSPPFIATRRARERVGVSMNIHEPRAKRITRNMNKYDFFAKVYECCERRK